MNHKRPRKIDQTPLKLGKNTFLNKNKLSNSFKSSAKAPVKKPIVPTKPAIKKPVSPKQVVTKTQKQIVVAKPTAAAQPSVVDNKAVESSVVATKVKAAVVPQTAAATKKPVKQQKKPAAPQPQNRDYRVKSKPKFIIKQAGMQCNFYSKYSMFKKNSSHLNVGNVSISWISVG